jgi:hypothetical protein
MVQKHNILLATSIVLCLGTATLGVFGYREDKALRAKYREQVVREAGRLKACPDLLKSKGDCVRYEDRMATRAAANRLRDEGRYEQAGLKYVQVGDESDARTMAGRCGKEGRRRILSELKLRNDAKEEALKSLPK